MAKGNAHALDAAFYRLLSDEGLADFAKLLTPRAFDEVPLSSRYSRLKFLGAFDPREKSRLMVTLATRHYDALLKYRDRHVPQAVILLSITDWDALEEPTGSEPVMPNFWISWKAERELLGFRLRHGTSRECGRTRAWLDSEGLLLNHWVMDPVRPTPEVQRVYIGSVHDHRLPRLLSGD